MMPRMASFKLAAVCCCFLALAACSKKNTPIWKQAQAAALAKRGWFRAGFRHQCW